MFWCGKVKELSTEKVRLLMWTVMLHHLAKHAVLDETHKDLVQKLFCFNIFKVPNRQILTALQQYYGFYLDFEDKIKSDIEAIKNDVLKEILSQTPSDDGTEDDLVYAIWEQLTNRMFFVLKHTLKL